MIAVFASVAVAAAVFAAGGARAWLVSMVPIQVDSHGASRLVDTQHQPATLTSPEPECEIIAIIFHADGGSPFPAEIKDGETEVYMVVLTDPLDDNEVEYRGCVNHPQGACSDETYYNFRTNYRHLRTNAGVDAGYNWCVPKGWQSECDYPYGTGADLINTEMCPNHEPETYDCPRCDNANQCDTTKYGRHCQTLKFDHIDEVSGNATYLNPSHSQGDCHFGYEIMVFNKRPSKCRVEPFVVHSFDAMEMVLEEEIIHYVVVVEGDDNAIGNDEQLKFYFRSFPIRCLEFVQWEQDKTLAKTAVVEACQSSQGTLWYHGLSTLFVDSGKDFNPELGVGHHCAGHMGNTCSPKHFADDMFPFGRCRIFGCAKMPEDKHIDGNTCMYGDLLVSTNFEFDLAYNIPNAEYCSDNGELNQLYEVVYTGLAKKKGPLTAAGSFDEEPNFCCNLDTIHHANPNDPTLAGGPLHKDAGRPCGLAADGRQLVFDRCGVCDGTGKSCVGASSSISTGSTLKVTTSLLAFFAALALAFAAVA